MNKHEFKSAYSKIALSEDFKSAAKEKLLAEYDKASQSPSMEYEEHSAKAVKLTAPAGKKSPWKTAAAVCAAAAAVGLGVWGVASFVEGQKVPPIASQSDTLWYTTADGRLVRRSESLRYGDTQYDFRIIVDILSETESAYRGNCTLEISQNGIVTDSRIIPVGYTVEQSGTEFSKIADDGYFYVVELERGSILLSTREENGVTQAALYAVKDGRIESIGHYDNADECRFNLSRSFTTDGDSIVFDINGTQAVVDIDFDSFTLKCAEEYESLIYYSDLEQNAHIEITDEQKEALSDKLVKLWTERWAQISADGAMVKAESSVFSFPLEDGSYLTGIVYPSYKTNAIEVYRLYEDSITELGGYYGGWQFGYGRTDSGEYLHINTMYESYPGSFEISECYYTIGKTSLDLAMEVNAIGFDGEEISWHLYDDAANRIDISEAEYEQYKAAYADSLTVNLDMDGDFANDIFCTFDESTDELKALILASLGVEAKDTVDASPAEDGEVIEGGELIEETYQEMLDKGYDDIRVLERNYYSGGYPRNTRSFYIEGLPDVKFVYTNTAITAVDESGSEEVVISGMPIWDVYLADLNGDGIREICAVLSYGSGLVDTRIAVYDYAAKKYYELSDRFNHDYAIVYNGLTPLMVRETDFNSNSGKLTAMGELVLYGDTLTFDSFGEINSDNMNSYTQSLPVVEPDDAGGYNLSEEYTGNVTVSFSLPDSWECSDTTASYAYCKMFELGVPWSTECGIDTSVFKIDNAYGSTITVNEERQGGENDPYAYFIHTSTPERYSHDGSYDVYHYVIQRSGFYISVNFVSDMGISQDTIESVLSLITLAYPYSNG